LKEAKDVIKSEKPNLKMADVLKVVAEKWKSLDDKQKIKYQSAAQVEKEAVKCKIAESAASDEGSMPLPQKRIQSQKRVKKALIRENAKIANTEGFRMDEVETSDSSPFEDAVFVSRSESTYAECERFNEELPVINFNWCRMPSMDPIYYNAQEEIVKKETEVVFDATELKNKKSNDFLFDLLNFQARKECYEQDLYFAENFIEDVSVYNTLRNQAVNPSHRFINEPLAKALDFGLNEIDFDCFNFENTYYNTLSL